MTAFNSERERTPAGSTSLSDDDFSDLIHKDSDSGCEAPGMDKSSDDESGCESKGESDDGNIDEECVSMPRLMGPSVLEEKKGYKSSAKSPNSCG